MSAISSSNLRRRLSSSRRNGRPPLLRYCSNSHIFPICEIDRHPAHVSEQLSTCFVFRFTCLQLYNNELSLLVDCKQVDDTDDSRIELTTCHPIF